MDGATETNHLQSGTGRRIEMNPSAAQNCIEDVLFEILHNLPPSSLAATALLCRAWLRASRVLLYRHIHLDITDPCIHQMDATLCSSPHLRNRIWQEAITTLILTNPECKIPHDQRMYFVIAPNAEYPPFLSNFEGSPGERHVENLKVSTNLQL